MTDVKSVCRFIFLHVDIRLFQHHLLKTMLHFVAFFPLSKIIWLWSSRPGAAETNLTRNHEVESSIPGLVQWVRVQALPWTVV